MPSDIVRLVINGSEITGWTGATINMNIDTVADAFSVSAAFDHEKKDIRDTFRPFGYQRVQVYIGDDIVLSGRIDKIDPAGGLITVQGRALPGVLGDCPIEGELEHSGLTLGQLARKLCAPFGVLVRVDHDTGAIDVARAEYGQVVADFLNSLAAPRNILLNSSYKGELVISSADDLPGKRPVANLEDAVPPLLSCGASYDATARFSSYTIATQNAGESNLSATSKDSGVKIYRPTCRVVDDAEQDLDVTARRARSVGYARGVSVSASIAGWRRPDGKLWAERQAVNLTSPSAMIYTMTKFIIAGMTYKLDEQGQTSDFRLVDSATYSGAMPRSEPWA